MSQGNYTLTNYAEHSQAMSHDAINRFLRDEKMTPRLVWDNVRGQIVALERGYVIFDDTVLDKDFIRQGFFAQDRVGSLAIQRERAWRDS